jgi:hypothetical protein
VPDHTDSRIIFERNHGHLQKICLAGGGGGWKVARGTPNRYCFGIGIDGIGIIDYCEYYLSVSFT